MFKGQVKADYQREYMRRRRAAMKQAPPKATKPQHDTAALEALKAELARERARRDAVEAELARAKNEPPPLPRTREEYEAAKRAATEARSKRAKEAAAAKVAKVTDELAQQDGPVTVESLAAELVKKDTRIKSLTTRCKNLAQEVAWLNLKPNARAIMMHKWLHRQAKANLLPDRLEQLLDLARNGTPDEIAAERKRVERVSQAFNALDVIYPEG